MRIKRRNDVFSFYICFLVLLRYDKIYVIMISIKQVQIYMNIKIEKVYERDIDLLIINIFSKGLLIDLFLEKVNKKILL